MVVVGLTGLFALVGVPRSGETANTASADALREPGKAISIAWGGDMALDRGQPLPADGQAGLHAVGPTFSESDLALVNLEGTVGRSGTAKCVGADPGTCFAFQAPPEIAHELAAVGIDAVNLANNHSFDAGMAGVNETTAALDAAEVSWTGLTGTTRVVGAGGSRVALVGIAPHRWADDLRDPELVHRRVRSASRLAPIVITMMHAGREGQDAGTTPVGRETAFGEDRGDTRAAAHAAIDAGADLVLGSGPHVVRGIERYRRRLIAYSTGNLVGNDTLSLSGEFARSALLRVRVAPDGTPLTGRVVSLVLARPGIPVRDPTRAAAARIDAAGARDFGAGAVRLRADGVLKLPTD